MNIEQFIDITIRVVANWKEAAKKKCKEKLLREKKDKNAVAHFEDWKKFRHSEIQMKER